jgi:hypothetical protein
MPTEAFDMLRISSNLDDNALRHELLDCWQFLTSFQFRSPVASIRPSVFLNISAGLVFVPVLVNFHNVLRYQPTPPLGRDMRAVTKVMLTSLSMQVFAMLALSMSSHGDGSP